MVRRLQVGMALAALGLLCSCETPTATVNFQTGPLLFMARSSQFSLPDELRDGMQVASVPCDPMGRCPTSDTVTIACEAGTCDPQPTEISFPVGDVIDFDELASDLRELFKELDSVEITEISYEVRLNTLTVDTGDIELFWGPEGASDVDSPGVHRLGVVPSLPARSTAMGLVDLDAEGNAALSDYVVGTSRRVRFFASTTVDLEPGGPFPAGELTVAVDMGVRATGTVLE